MAEPEKVEAKKEEKEKPKKAPAAKQAAAAPEKKDEGRGQKKKEEKLTSIVRLAGKDVNGSLPLYRAIDQVKGVGTTMANALSVAIETKLNIPRTETLGNMTEEQIEKVETVIKNPAQYGVPQYFLNHQKDMESGKNLHLVSNDLLFATRQDIARDVGLKTWRGYRHQYGQKVRGQHTRSTGRTGATVGVMKKAELAKTQPAKAGEKKEEAAAPKKEEKKPAA